MCHQNGTWGVGMGWKVVRCGKSVGRGPSQHQKIWRRWSQREVVLLQSGCDECKSAKRRRCRRPGRRRSQESRINSFRSSRSFSHFLTERGFYCIGAFEPWNSLGTEHVLCRMYQRQQSVHVTMNSVPQLVLQRPDWRLLDFTDVFQVFHHGLRCVTTAFLWIYYASQRALAVLCHGWFIWEEPH